MTVQTVTLPDVADKFREAGRLLLAGIAWVLFGFGWALVKVLRLVGTVVGAALIGVGWFAARVVWPALLWAGDAVKLGWQQGRATAKAG